MLQRADMKCSKAIRLARTVLVLSTCVLAMNGCTVDRSVTGRRTSVSGQNSPESERGVTEAAFEPIRLRVHPLTHLDFEAASDGASDNGKKVPESRAATLSLHYELRDQFTDPVKGLGVLRVEATRRGSGTAGNISGESATWDVADLADPTINSRRFDPATRTYRVSLTAPDWMKAWATAQNSGATEGRGSVVLKVTLVTPRGDGTRRMLTDEFVMER